MLAQEWQELERVSARIATIRERYAAAKQSNNVGLLRGLANEMEAADRERDRLIRHISAYLGAMAA